MSLEIMGSPPNKNKYKKYAKGNVSFSATSYGQVMTLIINGFNFKAKGIYTSIAYTKDGSGVASNNGGPDKFIDDNGIFNVSNSFGQHSIYSFTDSEIQVRVVDPNSTSKISGKLYFVLYGE